MQSVSINIIKLIYKNSCKGTGYIPSHYRPCPRCGGQGKGLLKDCRLCDDLCYVTEPWVQCQVCFGKGKQGNLGALSQDCTACNGFGFTKPGMGVNVYGGPGMMGPGYNPGYGGMPGYGPHGYGPGYGPHGFGPHGYGPRY